jgi:hypothetical protein
MKGDDKTKGKKKDRAHKLVLKFTCPDCGCHDLQGLVKPAHFSAMPISKIQVILDDSEGYEMYDREISEWDSTDECQILHFQCSNCGLIPSFDDEDGQHPLVGIREGWNGSSKIVLRMIRP